MIKITDKSRCCGCNACTQRCPKRCIAMREDEEGFPYPVIDETVCIDCGVCEKVCPVINQGKERRPIAVYAAKNADEDMRRKSSSGGIFTALAEQTIEKGGVVFGARFDENWEIRHDYTETVEGLAAFRGSKYVQSRTGEAFAQAEMFLKKGREVLFTGTPCQISALKKFLKRDYDGLLAVDFICHGVPSPGVWREYLKQVVSRLRGKRPGSSRLEPPLSELHDVVESISFRDKSLGWKKFSFSLSLSSSGGSGGKNAVSLSEPLNKNLFMRGFLANLYLRPSCYACPIKREGGGDSDITLGDYWGIASLMPDYDDDKGVSAVIINTEKGKSAYSCLNADNRPTSFEALSQRNPSLTTACDVPKNRDKFFSSWKTVDLERLIARLAKKSIQIRVRAALVRALGAILGKKGIKAVKKLLKRQ